MNHNVLLTGVTGFVGQQIFKNLQSRDCNITLVVRPNWKDKIKDKGKIAAVFETEDLFSESVEWWQKVCKNIDTIIHAAWYVEPSKYLLSDKNIDCLSGTLNLARGAVVVDVKRVIGLGTCFEYDLTGGLLSINTPLKPLTPYAAAKASTYWSLAQYLHKYNVEFSWCRLFYLYGEGEDKRRLVPYIRSRLENNQAVELTSGKQIRDFMDVARAGQQIVDVALGKTVGAINICSGVPITVRQLAERIADEYGKRELLHFGVRADNIVDPACVVGLSGKVMEC